MSRTITQWLLEDTRHRECKLSCYGGAFHCTLVYGAPPSLDSITHRSDVSLDDAAEKSLAWCDRNLPRVPQ